MAVVSINLDKANLSNESHKTLGFTIIDSFRSDLAHIAVCQKYNEAYGLQRLLVEVPRAPR